MAFFGDTSKINKVVDGVLYGLAVRLWTPSTAAAGLGLPPEPTPIVTGVIEGVEMLGGGSFRLKMRRAPQTFFYVIPPQGPGQGSQEVPYLCEMGGNIAMPAEWQRGYSHLNDLALRGSLMGSRVVEGDGGRLLRDRPTLPGMVTRALAHGIAPSAVNYAGSAPYRPPRFQAINLYRIAATREGPVVRWVNRSGVVVSEGDVVVSEDGQGTALEDIPPGATGNIAADLAAEIVFSGLNDGPYPSGLVIWDDDEPTLAERVIFTPPGGSAPDDNWLPPDLGGGDFEGAKYWWDPLAYEVRLSSGCFLAGNEADLVYWLRTELDVPGEEAGQQHVVVGSGAGPGGFADEVVISALEVGGDFDWEFMVFDGEGVLEWRQSGAAGARRATLELGAAGPAACSYRAATNAASATEALSSSPTYSLPYQVRLVKDGGEFTFFSRQDGNASWAELASVELAGVVAESDGFAGLGTYADEHIRGRGIFTGQVTRRLLQIGAEGTHAVLRSTGRVPFVVAGDTGMPAADVAEVLNLTTGQAMTPGSGVKRNQYRLLDGTLWAVAENSGDRWQVNYQQGGAPPTPPGRAPRPVPGQVERGWVELIEEPNPDFLPTTNVANNKANWHDLIELTFEDGTIPQVGEQIEFLRWGAIAASPAPVVRWALRAPGELDEDGEEMAIMPASAYRAYWFAGLLLVRQDWLTDNVPPGRSLCVAVEGRVVKTDLLQDAARWAELRAGVKALEDLWVEIPVESGVVSARGGYIFRDYGWTEKDELDRVTAIGIGLWRSRYRPGNPPSTMPGAGETPFWAIFTEFGGAIGFIDTLQRSGYIWTGPPETEFQIIEGDAYAWVFTSPGNWNAGQPNVAIGYSLPRNNLTPLDYASSFASVQGTPFNPNGVFSKLPDDAEILEAWVEVVASNLREHRWEIQIDVGPGLYSYRREVWNGELVFEFERDGDGNIVKDFVPINPDPWVEGATLGFEVIGKRIDSRNVVDWVGNPLQIPAHEYLSVGGLGTSASAIESDRVQFVNVTGAMQRLLQLRKTETAFDGYELWPSLGVGVEGEPEGLTGYLMGIAPTVSYSQDGDPDDPAIHISMSGRRIESSGIEVRRLLVRFRTGLGGSDLLARPLNWPPAV
jgi:hypothetical protein